MEFLVLVLFGVLLLVILKMKSTLLEQIQQLSRQVELLKDKLETPKPVTVKAPEPVPAAPEIPVIKEVIPPVDIEPPAIKKDYWSSGFEVVETPEEPPLVTPAYTPPETRPTFFERNPDLEKFIGENLVSKIGIAILVLAIGYFVKFAIDNDWIGPVGRVAIGVLCGGILLSVAHYLRKSYHAFSSVLVGGGLAVLYFTITLGYHQFHLFSQSVAFAIMLVITGFSVALALLYDRQELAIIALVGGFLAPFMVSDNSGNFRSLFTYLIILNAGLLVLAYYKAWRLLNLLAFIFTIVLFSGWIFSLPSATTPSTYSAGFIFATIFYALFFVINIAHNIREQKKFIASDFGILLANTALYYSAGMYFLSHMQAASYQGLFCILMALLNLGVSYFLFRTRKVDTNILYLLIGITLTFISLTAPIQLHGNYITLFWATEAVLLYWLFGKSGLAIIRWSSFVVLGAALVSLLMDWFNIYLFSIESLPVIFNKGCLTGIYTGLAFFAYYYLVRQKEHKYLVNAIQLAAWTVIYLAGILEIDAQFSKHLPETNLSIIYGFLFTAGYALLYHELNSRLSIFGNSRLVYIAVQILVVLVYLLQIVQVFHVQSGLLTAHRHQLHFLAHWAGVALTAWLLYQFIVYSRANRSGFAFPFTAITWIFCAVVVIFISAEAHLLINQIFYSEPDNLSTIQRVYIKAGLPILWGLCSFVFMWLGMRNKNKTLRIVSLTLFSITLVKLFTYDIRNIPVAGKIAAFFCLGVLLLVVSFMYQRLKKIIIDDEQKTSA